MTTKSHHTIVQTIPLNGYLGELLIQNGRTILFAYQEDREKKHAMK